MANQQWVSLLNPASTLASGAGTALSTATTAVLSPQASVANQDVAVVQAANQPLGWYVGLLIRITARGFITTTATGTTVTYSLRANKTNNTAVASNTVLATSAGISTPAAANTGIPWKIEALIRCTAIASSGNTVSTQGEIWVGAIAAQTILTGTADVTLGLPNASGETAAAVDTTVFQGIQCAGTLAGANATVQLTQWLVEALD